MDRLFDSLSPFEQLQIYYAIREVMAADAINMVSVISAYLIVAYWVGAKLSRLQVWVFSILYSMLLYGNGLSFTRSVIEREQLQVAMALEGSPDFAGIYTGFFSVIVWIMSLVFMRQTRRAQK